MAVLGFHIVISLVVLTIISKLGTRLSIIQLYIAKGLIRYIAPSNSELRSLLPVTKQKSNPRQRKRQQEEEDASGFNIPKQLPLRLRAAPVAESELQNFPLFSSLHWLSLFAPLCLVVYVMSESYLYFFPTNGDTNVSVLWLIIAIAFVLQVLASLTSWFLVNDSERSLLITFAALYFLVSCIFTMWSDRFFDVHMLEAYDKFSSNVASLMVETGAATELDDKPKSPLLLYISLSVFFSFLSAMLVFPNFRFATMYTRALEMATAPTKILLHLSFLMPLFTLVLFSHPVKTHICFGPRQLLTEHQLDILRVYTVIISLLLRMTVRRIHLQAHLDLAHEKVQLLQRETGYVKNIQLQSLIFRYYSYFCAACLQYFAPILLSFFFALLLKTTGDLSWFGSAPSSVPVTSSSQALSSLRHLFDSSICRAVWSYSLIITTFINLSLSLIGVLYNTYFARA